MKKASEKLIDLSEDTDMIGLYDREIVERKVRNSMIKTAKREGIEQGIAQKQKEIIINMLKENIDIDIISKVTGISKEEILNINN